MSNSAISLVSSSAKFANLSDVPNSYVGQGGLIIQVKEDESGLQFIGGLVKLSEQILVGAVSSVTFSSISQKYRNLILMFNSRGSAAVTDQDVSLQFNSDTGANYDRQWQNSTGSAVSTGNNIAATSMAVATNTGTSAPSGAAAANHITIYDYARTAYHKTVTSVAVKRNGTSSMNYSAFSGNWRSTAAINAIKLIPAAGNFSIGDWFALYAEF